jgi:hypothetical protein
MIWLAHDSEEHAKKSAVVLAGLGCHARKLLADSVVTTGVKLWYPIQGAAGRQQGSCGVTI